MGKVITDGIYLITSGKKKLYFPLFLPFLWYIMRHLYKWLSVKQLHHYLSDLYSFMFPISRLMFAISPLAFAISPLNVCDFTLSVCDFTPTVCDFTLHVSGFTLNVCVRCAFFSLLTAHVCISRSIISLHQLNSSQYFLNSFP